MEKGIIIQTAELTGLSPDSVERVLALMDDGATIPFIARYRKEATRGLDEVQIGNIADTAHRLEELAKRKETVIKSIRGQNRLTPELEAKIAASWDAAEIEDIYLPFKPKRRTRATVARKAGLVPLAKMIMSGRADNIMRSAQRFANNEIADAEAAISGAVDIIAEWVSESAAARHAVRSIFARRAVIHSRVIKGKEGEGSKYRDYFDKEIQLSRCPSYALLAMRRGESEKILRVDISADEEECVERLNRIFVRTESECSAIVRRAVRDGYKRLLQPSIETEFAALSKERADREAIKIFSANLRQLLLSAPLGQKRTMGIDPGFRSGCKVVCLDENGNLLHNETVYPHPPHNERAQAMRKISTLVEQYRIEAIAVGNGTAGRETEQFIQAIRFNRPVQLFSVSESGASVYSASAVAREEFPDYDVTVRGAVSIGRRLMDPLAELVKINPKSIGVGQYQHDVNQTQLKEALDRTVINCVNTVGVELNSASLQLLSYVSGVGPKLAQNIIDYRTAHGGFRNRRELLNVDNLGAKTYEQCAGFLRIGASDNPLDRTAVHPESYHIVERMAKDLDTTVEQLIKDETLRLQINLERYMTPTVGMPTLRDIMAELDKPGRDPRNSIETFEFDSTVHSIDDLRPGMTLPGIVTNVTDFGAFVDIGIKENGLVHKSQMAEGRVLSPADVVGLHQHVTVRVLEVDAERRRISLSMTGI